MSTTSIDVEVMTIENHPKLNWVKIAHFSGTDHQHSMQRAAYWINSTFKYGMDLPIRMVDDEGLIVGSWNYDYNEETG